MCPWTFQVLGSIPRVRVFFVVFRPVFLLFFSAFSCRLGHHAAASLEIFQHSCYLVKYLLEFSPFFLEFCKHVSVSLPPVLTYEAAVFVVLCSGAEKFESSCFFTLIKEWNFNTLLLFSARRKRAKESHTKGSLHPRNVSRETPTLCILHSNSYLTRLHV